LLPPERLEQWKKLHDVENQQQSAPQIVDSDVSTAEVMYYLPFAGGTRWPVYQDYNKHFDFSMPIGTDVYAARVDRLCKPCHY
jgi:predicted P-loop ATPase/GTPase